MLFGLCLGYKIHLPRIITRPSCQPSLLRTVFYLSMTANWVCLHSRRYRSGTARVSAGKRSSVQRLLLLASPALSESPSPFGDGNRRLSFERFKTSLNQAETICIARCHKGEVGKCTTRSISADCNTSTLEWLSSNAFSDLKLDAYY